MRVLPQRFYLQDSVTVAQAIIGKLLVRETGSERLVCRIVETEAYNQEDPASHSFRGLTARTAPMFERGGIAYVYFIYGMYDCFNVVTDRAGYGSAVLVRGAEPVAGLRTMWRNRFPERDFPGSGPERGANRSVLYSLADGPGKLARAMGITRQRDNRKDLRTGDLTIRDDGFDPGGRIEKDVRIGISVGTEVEWRFYLSGNPCVSRLSVRDRQGGAESGGHSPSSSTSRSRSSVEK